MTLFKALSRFEPHVAKLMRSPTTHDPQFELDWIGLLAACERETQGIESQTIRCIREHAVVTRNKRLRLIADAKEASHG